MKDWDWLELQLVRYRYGFVSVRLDFKRRVLIWKDGNRWCNNFVRALSDCRLIEAEVALQCFLEQGRLQAAALSAEETLRASEEVEYVWYLFRSLAGEASLYCQGQGIDNHCWQNLANTVSAMAERPFRL